MNPLLVAFSTLSLLPIPASNPTPQDLKRSVLWYPLVGAVLGAGFSGIHLIPIAHDLQALLALFFWIGFTGAFHLDGLGDCLDGFFGGKNPQDRQRIMKTADLGTYGMAGIAFILIAKTVLLNHLLGQNNASHWLLAIPVAARWTLCLSCFISQPPAGSKGLGSFVIGSSLPVFFAGTLLAAASCVILQVDAIGVFLIAGIISFAVSRFSKSRIGGLTGDGLGATIELTETALLFFACLAIQ